MKLLVVINSLNMGGAEKLIVETLPYYIKSGIEADVFLLNPAKTPLYYDLKNLNICRIYIGKSSNLYSLKNIFALSSRIKNYDLVHAHLFPAHYFSVIAKTIFRVSTPIIITEHNTSNRRFRNSFFSYINSIVYRRFDKIICITEEVKRQVVKFSGISEEKLIVIENGVDLSKINNALPLHRYDINPKISDQDFLVLQVSSFRKQKDQKTAIKSMKLLPSNIKLLFAGDGPLREEAEQLVKTLELEGRVFFLGNRQDVPKLLKTVDVVILSSHYEGLSLASIEGMASSKPFIASDVDGLKEIVKNYGLLFTRGDENALSLKIMKLMNDEIFYNHIAKRCKIRANMFDIKSMIEKHINLYLEIQRHKSSM